MLDTENKRVSLALAEACGNMAMLKIAQNPDYGITPPLPAAGECVGVSDTCPSGPRMCKICKTSPYVLVRAVYNGAYTNLRVEGAISGSNFAVSKWEEIEANLVPGCNLP